MSAEACYFCDEPVGNGKARHRHVQKEHPHICYYCRFTSKSAKTWIAHVRAHPMEERVNVQHWRWLYAHPGYRVLHRIAVMTANSDDERGRWDFASRACTGVAVCGYEPKGDGKRLPRGLFFMPGIFSRMGLPRCAKCCRKLGLPPGNGTPWNDKTLPEEMRSL